MREWLDEAVFYEIYPQSFRDSNADGIGDIPGIIEKLDYIQSLGCNALWLNPCFDSPFVDAGYDVRDFFLVAPRYGTNGDLQRLFAECHRRGMHVLLDLVPGHTSDQCAWFKESARAAVNPWTDRYIWSDNTWESMEDVGSITGVIRGGTEREGTCGTNFFNAQPALNYGFLHPNPEKPWQQAMDAPGPLATREAMKDVMRFWLGLGCDGFRVDMAGSLVKSDPDQKGTISLWQDFRRFLEAEYPEAVMVSEWGQPDRSLLAGFHMDFLLHFGPSHYPDLFRTEHPFFSRRGEGSCKAFFDLYQENLEKTLRGGGMICIPSGNHDMDRMARSLDPEEMKIAFAFLLSMPGVPFIYYGDEIGMKYVEGLASVEGGYKRTGTRSPMAFDTSSNAGFSAAPPSWLYIPQDASVRTINAETESKDENSLISEVRRLTALRKARPALGNRGAFRMVHLPEAGGVLAYERAAGAEKILVILNPADRAAELPFPLPDAGEVIYTLGKARPAGLSGKVIPGASAVFIRS